MGAPQTPFGAPGFILTQAAWAFGLLRWAGAAYLVYLGCRMLFGAVGELGNTDGAPAPRSGLFREAFVVTVSNPKAVFFFSALFPQFFANGQLTLGRAAALSVVTLLTTFACMMIYAAAGQRVQWAFRRARFRTLFQRGVGATLVGFGAGLAFDRKWSGPPGWRGRGRGRVIGRLGQGVRVRTGAAGCVARSPR